ncbi:hypothetical protein FDC27_00425 [Clostridium botulinum]|nr:hypothetical protein [Clostridium botulinum]
MNFDNEITKNIKKENTINEYIKNMEKYNPVHIKQKEYIEALVNDIYENDIKDIISIVPCRCGIGKSTSINAILYQLANSGIGKALKPLDGYGAIFITDNVERLNKTYNYSNLYTFAYLMKYKEDSIEEENRKTFGEQIKEQYNFPILLITTQKYFKMTKEERQVLYKWRGGTRELCLIDEKPYLIKSVAITERYLSKIRIALEEVKKCDDKTYLLDTWKIIYNDLDIIRDRMASTYTTMWLKNSKKSLLFSEDEDKKFFKILSQYVTTTIYEDTLRLKDIYTNGCLFVSSDNKDTDNSRQFILTYNNIDKFDTDKCKYYILDATSKFDIDYLLEKKALKYMNIDDEKADKDIRVNMIPFSTSQKKLKETGEYSNTDVICGWINKSFSENLLVACNRGTNGMIYNRFNNNLDTENIEYFGNIKGKNEYESLKEMVHIGFNRFSDIAYLETYIVLYDMANKFNNSADADIQEEINTLLNSERGQFTDLKMRGIFRSKCIVDTVQNVMRIKCRHFTNIDKCTIWIITSLLYEDVVRRVASNIGAEYYTFSPTEFEEAKTMSRKPNEGKDMTNPQKIKTYLNKITNGTIIKMADIIAGSGCDRNAVKNAVKKNPELNKWFDEHKGEKRGQYVI